MNKLISIVKHSPHIPSVIAIFATAIILRFIVFILFLGHEAPFVISDSNSYRGLAQSITSFNYPHAHRPPGYPIYLLLLGNNVYIIIISQIILDSIVAVLTYFLAITITNNRIIALIAGILYSISLPNVMVSNIIMSETFFTFLLLTSITLFIHYLKNKRKLPFIISSLLLGLAVLTRPGGILLILGFTGIILYLTQGEITEKILVMAAYLFIFAATLVPWCLVNQKLYGRFMLTNVGDIILPLSEAPAVLAYKENPSIERLANINLYTEKHQQIIWDKIKKKYNLAADRMVDSNELYDPKYSNLFKKEVDPIIFQNIDIVLLIHFFGVFRIFFMPWEMLSSLPSELKMFSWLYPTFGIIEWLISISFLIGLFVLFKHRFSAQFARSIIVLFLCTIFFYTILPAQGAEARFAVPVRPLVLTLSSITLCWFAGKLYPIK